MPGVTAVVGRHPRVLFTRIEEGAVLLNPTSGLYYGLNDVGARFWELACVPQPLGAIHAALLAEFDVTPETLWQDLTHLVQELHAEGLLEVDDAAAD